MTNSVDVLEHSVQLTSQWLDDVAAYIDRDDRGAAYQALRAVLVCLRDRIGPDNAAHLAAQMPLLIRGIFYDGFRPAATPTKERTEAAFLAKVRQAANERLAVEPQQAAKAVFRTLTERLDIHEVEKIAGVFPEELRGLWPDLPDMSTTGSHPAEARHVHAR